MLTFLVKNEDSSSSCVWWQDADSLDVEQVLTQLHFIRQIRGRRRQVGEWERLQESYHHTHTAPPPPNPGTLTCTSHATIDEPHQHAGGALRCMCVSVSVLCLRTCIQVCICACMHACMYVTFSVCVFMDISAREYGCKDVLRVHMTWLQERIHSHKHQLTLCHSW